MSITACNPACVCFAHALEGDPALIGDVSYGVVEPLKKSSKQF
jgi:hypothetical protein